MNKPLAPLVTVSTIVSKPLLERIILATCHYYGIEEAELKSGKNMDQVNKKHICWYLIKENVTISYPRIGQRFNGENHATIIRAVEKIQSHKNIYAQTLHDIKKIMQIAYTLE